MALSHRSGQIRGLLSTISRYSELGFARRIARTLGSIFGLSATRWKIIGLTRRLLRFRQVRIAFGSQGSVPG